MATRGLTRELRRLLALTTALSVVPVLGSLLMLVPPAFADPCTGAVNAPNGTTCTNGTSAAGLAYVADNPLYTSGSFTLRLDNHDVNAAAGNGIGLTDVALGADGSIILENGSDVVSTADFGIDVAAVISATTINVNSASSVTGASYGIFATRSPGGSITVKLKPTPRSAAIPVAAYSPSVEGAGDILIDAQGTVSTVSGDGIFAMASRERPR